jgi:uncharacterized repeat protein (TIGR03806 family)
MVQTAGVLLAGLCLYACSLDGLNEDDNVITFLTRLSGYHIFTGDPSRLVPSPDFNHYELSTELFSDYAGKQRLIKVPAGKKIELAGDGLPVFPDSTMIVKTFFYYHDLRDTLRGKKVVETRLLIKTGSAWNAGTYRWNDQQTDAVLLTTGMDQTINWIDDNGKANVIAYHIPSNSECATCHNSGNQVIPIGFKARNLNRTVTRNAAGVNQLLHLMGAGLVETEDISSIHALPAWNDPTATLKERARAYLDINCAHCHHRNGFASDSNLFFSYELSTSDTRIGKRKDAIVSAMKNGRMPLLGTTLVHQKGVDLVSAYIKDLN